MQVVTLARSRLGLSPDDCMFVTDDDVQGILYLIISMSQYIVKYGATNPCGFAVIGVGIQPYAVSAIAH